MSNFSIAAVVVTFNRLELLKKVIDAIRNQTIKLDTIIIVNNSSSDGTENWLSVQQDLIIVKQPNLGSSGGQFTGFKTAFDLGYDYIWAMDDDVCAEPDCLENLLKFIQPKVSLFPIRITSKGTPLLYETKSINLSNPFKSIWKKVLASDDLINEMVEIDGPTFEGPLMNRELIAEIGLPEKKFFIYADDTEYFIRAIKKGYKNYLIPSAKLNRLIDIPEDEKIFTWKHFYLIRNLIAIDVLHGNFIVRWIRPFGYLLRFITYSKSISDITTSFRAFLAGYFYKSEN